MEVKDSLRYIFEEQQPAYHVDSSCERLQSNFQNFEIPAEIISKGADEIKVFRKWFKENSHLLEKPDLFVSKLHLRWGIITNPKSIVYSNSGSEDFSNLNLNELENKIDNILMEAGKFYKENPDKQKIIKYFGKLTFLAYINGDIYNNNTGLNDQELKDFLKYYDNTFKQPVKELLIQYYKVLYNPEMTFDGELLDKLNFRPCVVPAEGKSGKPINFLSLKIKNYEKYPNNFALYEENRKIIKLTCQLKFSSNLH